jgi:putative spermidine/putrescine transport system substrate-binding protein
MFRSLLALLALSFLSGAALAVEPVNASEFNVELPGFDLRDLTTENFYDVLVPTAQEQGSLVFYDFTDSFTPLFRDHIIPGFTARYGIQVEYFSVDGANAVQQLIAARSAARPPATNVFFMPNGQVQTANEAGVIANLPLHTMLPSAPDLHVGAATVARGYDHGGVVVPFHRNQTALAYDTRFVDVEDAPATLDELLEYARSNPRRVALTSPTGGGSGAGFLESAILHFAPEECQEELYDFGLTVERAREWAAGECLDATMEYFRELAPLSEITNGNTDTLTLMANAVAHVGTAWEDMAYDFMGRGLLPRTVRVRLLESGQVGDGDGVMIPSQNEKLAGALLFVDYMLSDEVQLHKLESNGSRSARMDLDVSGALGEEVLARLVPIEQYAQFGRARINNLISVAAQDRFVQEILQR